MNARRPCCRQLRLAVLCIGLLLTFTSRAGELHFAAEIGANQRVIQLVSQGANINEIDDRGIWPLLAAVTYGNLKTVALLLLLGADPNLADRYHYTALHEAAGLGYRQITEHLINAKADLNQRDINNYTPLGYAMRGGHQAVIELLLTHNAILSPTPNEVP